MEKRPVFATAEGRILLVGAGGWLLYLLALLAAPFADPELGRLLSAITVSHIAAGRAAGISVGFAMGAHAATVIAVNMLLEALLVLLVYPLFVMSWSRLYSFSVLEKWMDRARRNAHRYRPAIERYGIAGLFLFVWFPFWMTGPIVGSMIGYLIGLRHRVTLFVVLLGTLVAVVCWTLLLQWVEQWAMTFDARAPWLLFGLILLVVAADVLRRRFRNHREK